MRCPDMSNSRLDRGRNKGGARRKPDAAVSVLPPTVACAALLEKGSDRRFRTLVNDLLTIASRMEIVRAHLAARIGISGPQYSILVAVGYLQGEHGVAV